MECINKTVIWPHNKPLMVPCGKCIVCLSNRRRDWIFRLTREHKHCSGSLFVTLTYSNKYCPDKLDKTHVQLFIKRLRKHEKRNKIRYFLVGEYGSKFGRPHYHMLLFNADLSGESVRRAWCHPKNHDPLGIVHIGRVTEASIAYTTKYMVQPPKPNEKPFCLMSRGYGIGGLYLSDAMVNWHKSGMKNYVLVNGVKNRLPKFYKDKIWHGLEKEKVASKSYWEGIRTNRKNLRLYIKKFGKDAKAKMREFRDAHIRQIKTKVAFTQKL